MSDFQVNILGCGSATPCARHLPSSQVISYRNQLYMVDCGEGAQLQFRKFHLKFSRLRHIFISHLHGDHFLGLPGLLSTMSLHETGGCVVVHTFAEGVEILQRIMKIFCREPSFEIKYDVIKPEHAVVFENDALTIETFPLSHRIPTVGYLFREKEKLRHLRGDMIKYHNVPISQLQYIKAGADFVSESGRVIPNAHLTTDPTPAVSYAYCSDTMYDPRIAQYIEGAHTLYHEATYQRDNLPKARARGHSTAEQAGQIATLAHAKRLVVGHYSQSYDDDQPFAAEAATTFVGEVIAAHEGLTIDLP